MPDLAANGQAGPGYVEVALPVPLRRTFTYELTATQYESVHVGSRVVVPFGKRVLTGYVLEKFAELPSESALEPKKIKRVSEILDPAPLLTPEIVTLAKWTADYYLSFIGEVLKASLPAGMTARTEPVFSITDEGRKLLSGVLLPRNDRERLLAHLESEGPASRKVIDGTFDPNASRLLKALIAEDLVTSADTLRSSATKPKRRKVVRLVSDTTFDGINAAQQRVMTALRANSGQMPFTRLLEEAGVGSSPINTLSKRGVLEVIAEEVMRDPLETDDIAASLAVTLTVDQKKAFNEIEGAISASRFEAFLLHGVTGSGKTEVYIHAMQRTLENGRSSLMLVPEIALTPHFSRRLRGHFGRKVAILHSSLSAGERYDEWRRIHRGEARIVIGTRSAVFAPLRDLGLLIVDEEHDTSYRQHESPFYHARDVAVMRASLASAVIVLGSATPALETFYNAKSGKYRYLHLSRRYAERALAEAVMIDMREEFRRAGKDIVFSPQLLTAIRETFERGEQSMILLNRRGFSQFVLCRTCGESIKCINCDISLTYHKRDRRLTCHYCGYRAEPPDKCPLCSSEYLYFIGEGTEKLEDELARRFPDLRIARIDRDTVTRRKDMEKVLGGFSRGEIDMLVGTQMIAKGHDFPNVTLVGVVSVDLGLGLPDFRSAERTFQLLTQVAGRAGRGDLGGRVLIQTYHPEHYALRHAAEQDYEGFYRDEIRFREKVGYPPFFSLAAILVKHNDAAAAFETARTIRRCLDKANAARQCRILGPAPASISRLKGEYRVQMIIRSPSKRALRETIDLALAAAESAGCDMRRVHTEIDPVNLM